MKDPFGAVLTLIRDDPAVAAIVSGKVSSLVEPAPSVQIITLDTTRRPFGPGSGRMQMQLWTGVARCWAVDSPTGAVDSPTGAIAAMQLAGAVSDAIHNHRPTTVGTTRISAAYAPDIEGLTRDPETDRPFCDVVLNLYAGAQAVA